MIPGCVRCARIRLVLLSVVLGAGAGFAVLACGGSQDSSMAATFFAAIAPVLWHARSSRRRNDGTG